MFRDFLQGDKKNSVLRFSTAEKIKATAFELYIVFKFKKKNRLNKHNGLGKVCQVMRTYVKVTFIQLKHGGHWYKKRS